MNEVNIEKCIIRFVKREEQAKAFNYLIHSKVGFTGVDKHTIMLNKQECMKLRNENIHYEEVSSN